MNDIQVLPLAQWLDNSRADQTLVACGDERHYYLGEMRQQVIALCQRLQATTQQRWALCFDDSYWFTVALLAVLHSAKTAVIPGHSRESLLQEQRSRFDALLSDKFVTLDFPCLIVGPGQQPMAATETPLLPVLSADATVVLFTSGSRGQPREVVKPVASLDHEIAWLAALWGKRLAGCHLLSSVSHQHLYGLTFRIMLPMALGLSFSSALTQFPEQLAAHIAAHSREKRYVFISSPAFLRRLDIALPAFHCELVLSAGGLLPWNAACQAEQYYGVRLNEVYGSSETGVLAWRNCSRNNEPWQPFPGVRFSKDHKDLSDEKEKIWRVHSPLIPEPEGLLLDDRLDFSPGEGRFHLCGRQDQIIKIEEQRISLSEVEHRLMQLSGVAEAAALTLSRSGRLYIGAVIVLDAATTVPQGHRGEAMLTRAWRQTLRQWLEPVALPRYWRIVTQMPLNSQGKRTCAQLQELFYAAD